MGVDGGFLVAWQNRGIRDAPEGVRGQFFDASGARLGAELEVSTSTAGAPSNAAVAIGGDGSAVIVWQTTFAFGGRPAVVARQYGGSGMNGEGDGDGDGVVDRVDNCPTVSNTDQADVGGDGYGDACVAPDVSVPADARLGANPRIGARTIIEPGVSVGDDAMIGEDVRLGRGLRAGDRLILADFVSTGRRSTLGNDVTIGFATRFEGNVTVGDSVSIGDQVVVRRGVTIEDRATIHPLVVLFAGARIGAGAVVEMGARVGRGAVVAPGAVVPAGTTVPPGATAVAAAADPSVRTNRAGVCHREDEHVVREDLSAERITALILTGNVAMAFAVAPLIAASSPSTTRPADTCSRRASR